MGAEGWPKSSRLRRRREFLAVQARGVKAQGEFLTGLASPSRSQRVGLTVSTKVGNSVVRSKVKRHLREACRKNRGLLPESADVVLIARPGTDGAGLEALVRDLERLGRALKAKLSSPSAVRGRPRKPPRS